VGLYTELFYAIIPIWKRRRKRKKKNILAIWRLSGSVFSQYF